MQVFIQQQSLGDEQRAHAMLIYSDAQVGDL